MSKRKTMQSLTNLGKALDRLEEALGEKEMNSLYIDGTIQRFEFSLELYWKTLKRLLAEEGIETKTPRETLKQAFKVEWIDNEHAWLQMLRDRKETSHVYDEEKARNIYANIVEYFPEMKKTYTYLKTKFEENRSESPHD